MYTIEVTQIVRGEKHMKKGEIFKTEGKDKFYQIAGRFGKDIVLAPMDEKDEQVLIYSASELEELIGIGEFGKLHPSNIKLKNKE